MPIDPAALRSDCRFAISVDDDFEAELLQTLRKMREEKFGSAVIRRRNCNKWWRNQSDFQLLDPNIRWPREMKDQSQRLQFLYRSVSVTQKFWWNRGRGGGQRKSGVSLPSAQKTQHNAEKTGDCFIVGNSQNWGQ